MEFNERLDKIWDRISDQDFLENRGVANEVRYYVFDYEPCDELIIRNKIKALKKQNNPETDGFKIIEYDLYEMVIHILEEKGYIDKCIKFEDQKGMDYLYTAVTKMLRLTNDDNLIVNHIMENTPCNAVVFLTGVGKAFPFVRSHNILNNLGSIIFFVGLPPRNVLICYATLDRMEKQCCSFITDGEELKNNLLFLRQAT